MIAALGVTDVVQPKNRARAGITAVRSSRVLERGMRILLITPQLSEIPLANQGDDVLVGPAARRRSSRATCPICREA
jgi:hypothetical protein